jgi:SAM-dependent methyltransferase
MNIFLEKFIAEKFKKPGSSLDLGCGKGYDVACLKHIGWIVKGLDKKDVNLNKPYIAKTKFDLVYSNYVLQFINNKEIFIKSCFNNLKDNGWLYILTFSKNDKVFKNKGLERSEINKLLIKYFKNIRIRTFKVYDNEFRHRHWHKILEVRAQKNKKGEKK